MAIKRTVWLGRIENVFEEMTAANLIVLPTYREGLPRVILKVALANRAVIPRMFPDVEIVDMENPDCWSLHAMQEPCGVDRGFT